MHKVQNPLFALLALSTITHGKSWFMGSCAVVAKCSDTTTDCTDYSTNSQSVAPTKASDPPYGYYTMDPAPSANGDACASKNVNKPQSCCVSGSECERSRASDVGPMSPCQGCSSKKRSDSSEPTTNLYNPDGTVREIIGNAAILEILTGNIAVPFNNVYDAYYRQDGSYVLATNPDKTEDMARRGATSLDL